MYCRTLYRVYNSLSDTEDSLASLFDKLTNKTRVEFQGREIQLGWVKYSWNDSIWNLDDGQSPSNNMSSPDSDKSTDSDYTIFVWRQKSVAQSGDSWPCLHVRDPEQPLPAPPAYKNPSFYQFKPRATSSNPSRAGSRADQRSVKSSRSRKAAKAEPEDLTPKHKKEFEKFHSENGVRTILGNIGPVQNGESYVIYSYSC